MSSSYEIFPNDVDFYSDGGSEYEIDIYHPDGFYEADGYYEPNYGLSKDKTAVIVIILGVIVGIGLIGFFGRLEHATRSTNSQETAVTTQTTSPNEPKSFSADSLTFVSPYKDYTITQGLHGQSYGHLAIDLAAGRGEPILSPINGTVSQMYMDEYGNTTIVIENDVFEVMFLHGDYTVSIGDELKVGQQFGTEGNNGYTMDMAGNLCFNREWCGNHSHINVFDKRIQANINPLDVIKQ